MASTEYRRIYCHRMWSGAGAPTIRRHHRTGSPDGGSATTGRFYPAEIGFRLTELSKAVKPFFPPLHSHWWITDRITIDDRLQIVRHTDHPYPVMEIIMSGLTDSLPASVIGAEMAADSNGALRINSHAPIIS